MPYLFRGPRLHHRLIAPQDYVAVYEIFQDWPDDRGGKYSLKRAFDSVDRWLLNSKNRALPVDDRSNFEECLLHVEVAPGGAENVVGLTWSQIRGRTMYIKQRAIVRQRRGLSFSNDIDIDMQTYVFSVMQIQAVKFQVFEDVPQLVDKIGPRFKRDGEDVPPEQTETGKRLINAAITVEDYDALRAGQPPEEWVTFRWLADPIDGVDIPDRVVASTR